MKRTFFMLLVLAFCLSIFLSAAAEERVVKHYEFADWGIALDMPEEWLYQLGNFPPATDIPFSPSTGILSSKETFTIATWGLGYGYTDPFVKVQIFYTSAGTVERIEGVKDALMQNYTSRFSVNGRTFSAHDFEIIECGNIRAAAFAMDVTVEGYEMESWYFMVPFPMTMLTLQSGILKGEERDMKQLLIDMVSSLEYK